MLLVFEATGEYLLGCVGVASLFPINFLHLPPMFWQCVISTADFKQVHKIT
jgi:hypothetical protein